MVAFSVGFLSDIPQQDMVCTKWNTVLLCRVKCLLSSESVMPDGLGAICSRMAKARLRD